MFNTFPIPKPDVLGGMIKSIQSGSTVIAASSTTTTITVSPVNPKNSILMFTFTPSSGVNYTAYASCKIVDATTITFNRYTASAQGVSISWQLIEFSSVKSSQTGSFSSGIGTTVIPISTVNPNKAIFFVSFSTSSNASTSMNELMRYDLSASSITATSPSGMARTFEFQVLEFP
ncbi:hypothetical protein [Cohnella sp. AR92]|uniref:hypothetical protein n=1 Tax=Cohnella sp. AR92 TaxID=648716 RepID=UPI000F8E7BAC|nr:hypothetical protein [Cohnella sp. AR92]RUS42268.1 hypothetical protein ELR57_27025 [Cohnella sp. AR92]